MFSVLLTVISSLITYLQLSIPLVVYTRESEMTITGVKGYQESNAMFSTLQAETLPDFT